ncbi:MAG: phosphotransferase [Lachnospiraceae bacterium]|jgi:Ser/Thr protein kinase RdoA (MazF antagonist)|nr:phosphotransferase [Lachnospiraceae bacterium]
MKYVNANDVLPEELLLIIQKYYQGGYLYIPKGNYCEVRKQTDYKIELEKRNYYIYLKHLEGRPNRQIGNIYHLSESSIRRIILKEKEKYQKMKTVIEQILPLWGIGNGQLLQIYPSAWEVNSSYVIKVYNNKEQMERNIKISEILLDYNIPVAKIIYTKTGQKYVGHENIYFLMSEKLEGSNISDIKDKTMTHKMGYAIAQLHRAFMKCEKEIEFWDNSLLEEMKGWINESLTNNEWRIIGKEEYLKTVELLESFYNYLPKQLIHRDIHFGNFLFSKGGLSGYIDFDLSQRNIRIFDICYFLTGLLAEETDNAFTQNEWIENVKSVISGYESVINLSIKEKNAIPCVMESIEILFIAYFISVKDTKRAIDAYNVFHFIQNCESDIKNTI